MTKLTINPVAELNNIEILLNANIPSNKLIQWAEQNKDEIENALQKNGLLLIRGLKVDNSEQFGQLLSTLFGEELAEYGYRSTPRTAVGCNVYTATEYHSDATIAQHNECAYANKWAMRLGFWCQLPADEGGATPIADSREIYNRLPLSIRDKFEQKKVMYVRNYGLIDLPWQEVFQTEDKVKVEQYCEQNQIQFEWKDDGGLRTRQVNPAVALHPISGEKVWFNQAHLFHVSNLEENLRESMLSLFDQHSLPRNAFYGDGSPLEEEVLDVIRQVYKQQTYHFTWQKNDILLVDNMLFTHGRQPFKGERKVLVGMAQGHGH